MDAAKEFELAQARADARGEAHQWLSRKLLAAGIENSATEYENDICLYDASLDDVMVMMAIHGKKYFKKLRKANELEFGRTEAKG